MRALIARALANVLLDGSYSGAEWPWVLPHALLLRTRGVAFWIQYRRRAELTPPDLADRGPASAVRRL